MRVVAILLLASVASANGPYRIVERPPPAKPTGPTWKTSIDLEAKRDRPLFLYFTAAWCGYCHRMDAETFPDPKVRAKLAETIAVKIDVDREANRAVCARYRPRGGIPAFVIVDPDGTARGEFGGFHDAPAFLAALAHPPPPPPRERLPEGATLRRRIARDVDRFDEAFPTTPISRFLVWLGITRRRSVDEWVDRQNEALHDLIAIGEPAVPALLDAIENGSARTAERCATVLGNLRPPAVRPRLVALSRHERAPVRLAAVTGMGIYAHRAFLPALRERLLGADERLSVRTAAAEAIGGIAGSYCGLSDAKLAVALLDATRTDDASLRWECLQALLSVDAPIDLGRLFPLMEDRRVAVVFDGEAFTVSRCAVWVFLERSGQKLQRTDGADVDEGSPEAIAFLRAWYEEAKGDLAWDEKRGCYRRRRGDDGREDEGSGR